VELTQFGDLPICVQKLTSLRCDGHEKFIFFCGEVGQRQSTAAVLDASRRGSSSYVYQPKPRLTCCPPLLWMGVRVGIAAITAVVSQTTRHASVGCGMRVL